MNAQRVASAFFLKNRPVLVTAERLSKDLPNFPMKEITFLGRSNVGKSTLLNTLLSCTLASTSKRPGHTRRFHLFRVGNAFNLLDVPGYGHGSSVEMMEELGKYVNFRESLSRIYLLLDARRGVMDIDEHVVNLILKAGVRFRPCLTKCDEVSTSALGKMAGEVTDFFQNTCPSSVDLPLLLLSSKAQIGMDDLKMDIFAHVKDKMPLREEDSNSTPSGPPKL